MEILKFLKTSKFKKATLFVFLWILMLYTWILIYSLVFEQDKLAIDRYNFAQLEKVKSVLDKQDSNSYKFKDLKEFNKKFNQNIKPIKNCYFLADRNRFFENNLWDGGYVFWFQLESLISKFMYSWNYYTYPKYDLPIVQACVWVCYDILRARFKYDISHPCEEN